jgi:hypothetical protein
MGLSVEQIQKASQNEKLLDLLLGELRVLFPPELREDPIVFNSRLQSAPRGLRAMASTYELDVSMALDDLAWHFVNYHASLDLAEETVYGLKELGADEAADIFSEALAVVRSHWSELGGTESASDAHAWLDATGIQGKMNPLNFRMWNYLSKWPNKSLMDCWVAYARKHPEHCVAD